MVPNLYANDTGEAGIPAAGVEKWGDAIASFRLQKRFTGWLLMTYATT